MPRKHNKYKGEMMTIIKLPLFAKYIIDNEILENISSYNFKTKSVKIIREQIYTIYFMMKILYTKYGHSCINVKQLENSFYDYKEIIQLLINTKLIILEIFKGNGKDKTYTPSMNLSKSYILPSSHLLFPPFKLRSGSENCSDDEIIVQITALSCIKFLAKRNQHIISMNKNMTDYSAFSKLKNKQYKKMSEFVKGLNSKNNVLQKSYEILIKKSNIKKITKKCMFFKQDKLTGRVFNNYTSEKKENRLNIKLNDNIIANEDVHAMNPLSTINLFDKFVHTSTDRFIYEYGYLIDFKNEQDKNDFIDKMYELERTINKINKTILDGEIGQLKMMYDNDLYQSVANELQTTRESTKHQWQLILNSEKLYSNTDELYEYLKKEFSNYLKFIEAIKFISNRHMYMLLTRIETLIFTNTQERLLNKNIDTIRLHDSINVEINNHQIAKQELQNSIQQIFS